MGMLIQNNLCVLTAYFGMGAYFPPSPPSLQITASQRKKMKQKMRVELRKLSAMTELEAKSIQDLWQLDLSSRWRLYR